MILHEYNGASRTKEAIFGVFNTSNAHYDTETQPKRQVDWNYTFLSNGVPYMVFSGELLGNPARR